MHQMSMKTWHSGGASSEANPGLLDTPPTVYLHVWSGATREAEKFVAARYNDCRVVCLSHRELREMDWMERLRKFQRLRGQALVFFFESLEDLRELQLLAWSGIIHRCQETIIADACGRFEVFRRKDWPRMLPRLVLSAFADCFVLCASWILLRLLRFLMKPQPLLQSASTKGYHLAYLYPHPLDRSRIGGAMAHVRGFLSGLAAESARCVVLTARQLPYERFPVDRIDAKRHFYLFRESLLLSFNVQFAVVAHKHLKDKAVEALYQRHGRFIFSGALLSCWLRVPLVVEYNGSEVWIAEHWDPSRFKSWLSMCERVSLSAASLIVVVSEELRDELVGRGIPASRVLVNPNAVDPELFSPGCGGKALRRSIGFRREDVVACFVGTFSYWHGVSILQEAILRLLKERDKDPLASRIRCLLVGVGPHHAEIQKALQPYEELGLVHFAGAVSHDGVPAYLDAADILLSPHVGMPDGRPFFGSPTKLFEYMAMGKAIVASDLDQLGRVLRHQETAWLVPPGEPVQLAAAILRLAAEPRLRDYLGQNARAVALARHTWRQNAARVLCHIMPGHAAPARGDLSAVTIGTHEPLASTSHLTDI